MTDRPALWDEHPEICKMIASVQYDADGKVFCRLDGKEYALDIMSVNIWQEGLANMIGGLAVKLSRR